MLLYYHQAKYLLDFLSYFLQIENTEELWAIARQWNLMRDHGWFSFFHTETQFEGSGEHTYSWPITTIPEELISNTMVSIIHYAIFSLSRLTNLTIIDES